MLTDIAAPRRNRKFQRAELPPPLQLTPRDEQIIQRVGEHRFLTSRQIHELLGGSEQNILRRLNVLFHAGYLDRPRAQLDYYTATGSSPMVYALGDRGARLLIQRHGAVLPDREWQRKNRVGRPFIEHTLAIANFHVALINTTRTQPHIELINDKALIAAFPKAPVTLDRAFAWQTTVRRNDSTHKISVKPDYAFALKSPANGHRAYLVECDRATMPISRNNFDQTSIVRKFAGYIAGHAAKLHESTFGWKAFRVLFITDTPARAANMRTALHEYTKVANARRLFFFTHADTRTSTDLLALTWVDGNGQKVSLI